MIRLLVALASVAAVITGCSSTDDKPVANEPTKTVTVAPQACLDALKAARDIDSNLSQAMSDSSRYPAMIGEAVGAMADADNAKLAEVLAEMKSIQSKNKASLQPVSDARSAFESSAAACED